MVLGMITTADSIDYEQNTVYEFTILALDSGSPRLTGTTINSRNSSRKSEPQPASVLAFAQEQPFAQENTPKNMTRWLSGSLDRDWEVIYHTCDVMNLFILLHFYCLFYYHSTPFYHHSVVPPNYTTLTSLQGTEQKLIT